MGLGSKLKKAWSKTFGRGPLSIIGMGKGGTLSVLPGSDSLWNKAWGEVGTGIDTITGARAMEKLADAQAAANAEQIANAQRQASLQAGQVQQIQQSGTEEALSKILKKKSALQRSIRTQGQQRLGD